MTKIPQRRREFLIYSIIFLALGLVAAGIAYHHWYWPSEAGWLARQNAKKLKITALPLVGTPFTGSAKRIRASSPQSSTLLLETSGYEFGSSEESFHYFHIDTVKNAIKPSSLKDWEAATGTIIDYLQSGPAPGERPINTGLQKVLPGWKPTKSVGRYAMEDVLSPTGNYLALLSADGRFHPPVRALLWGNEAYADGQHYLEVRSIKDGTIIGLPVAVPLPTKIYTQVLWTADERFVAFQYRDGGTHYVIIVPTGLEVQPVTKIGADAKAAGYAIFQMDKWWEEWRGAREFQIRNESPKSPVLLFNMSVLRTNTPNGFLVYRYDPVERTLAVVDKDVWTRAQGTVYNESDLWPKDERDPRYKAALQNRDRTPEDREVLRNEGIREKAAEERRSKLLRKSPPAGKIVLGPYFSPDREHYATRSYDNNESETFFHEVFTADTGQPIVDLLELPKSLGGGPLWTPDGRYILYANQEERLLTIIHVD